MNHRSANRRGAEFSTAQAAPSKGIGPLNIKPELDEGKSLRFAEDFNLEHSLSGAGIRILTISASSIPMESARCRPSHPQDLNSPNCVYLG